MMKRSIDERRITICGNKRRSGSSMAGENTKKRLIDENKTRLGSSIATGEDTIAEIFQWLPVKSLLKFKALSKRWSYLISNPASFFRIHYLSTMGIRTRNRIVGRSDGDYSHHPIMLGYVIQQLSPHTLSYFYRTSITIGAMRSMHWKNYEKPWWYVAAAATCCGELDLQSHPAAAAADSRPFSLDHGPTDFLLHHFPSDQWRGINVVASSNGFLVCSLETRDDNRQDHCILANPITKEWTVLPKPKWSGETIFTSLACRGEYPLLALVEYTIVRLVLITMAGNFFVEVLSRGDEQWTRIDLNTIFGPKFIFGCCHREKTMAISTCKKEGSRRGIITVYCLVTKLYYSIPALVIVDLQMSTNDELRDDEEKILRKKMIKLPGHDTLITNRSHHIEQVDGEIHYVAFNGESLESSHLYVWVLVEDNSWLLKHKIYMGNLIRGAPWAIYLVGPQFYVDFFHPLNPKLVLLSISQKKVWCNVETETLEELSAEEEDLVKPGFDHCEYFHYTYQWPCWPPLL